MLSPECSRIEYDRSLRARPCSRDQGLSFGRWLDLIEGRPVGMHGHAGVAGHSNRAGWAGSPH